MHLVHVADGETRTLATDVSIAASFRQKLQGVMFRSSLPASYGLVFPFEAAKKRGVHMLFVRVPIDVLWLVDETVTAVTRLQPWTGFERHRADRIVELPAGAADAVSPGDRVELRE
ncbi:DUF192 domain-containing protein [Halodesulfurarchaeum sp. HSR-GB]|uniref:DUF192 domain-containing protein n=1 Tax=Halodesulfurarchaeum sp. HSR-GB TaxID=3074077 RepID=UPI002854FAD7|nr:DUF192 domain-containing protein [Halodesulfurarchaeum sp. HSR-GB]MDR5656729.1 DUF192 domain-containing protein [Halodesulfurarchaeum sp. HSR-GB]